MMPVIPQPQPERRGGVSVLLDVLGLILCVVVVFAAGCASVGTAPGTMNKAVAVPCPTSLPARPAFAADTLTGGEDIFTIGTALWADRLARQAYEIELEVRLKGCVEPAQ